MASRVNTKFVIILCAVLIVLVGGMWALYANVINRSAAYYEQRGDALLAEGEPKRAAESYLRGIGRQRDNIELLNKYIDLAEDLQMRSVIEARDTLSRIRGALRQAANYRSDDPKQLEAMFRFELDFARRFGDAALYTSLYELADNWIKDRSKSIIAIKYRGIAQVQRLSADLPEDQILRAEQDLTAAFEADPEDAEVLHHLALYKLKRAQMLDRPGGDRVAAQRLRAEALEVSDTMYAIDPKDPDRAIKHLTLLVQPQVRDLDAAAGIAENLEQTLDPARTPLTQLVTVANVLPMIDTEPVARGENLPPTTRGLQRSADLLEAAVEANPDSLSHRVLLGNTLQRMGRVDDALAQFDAARQMEARGNPIQTLRGANLKTQAAYQAGNLATTKAAAAVGEARTQWLDRADAAADELEEAAGDDSALVSKLRGKILLQRGRYDAALQRLTRANDQFQDGDMETLLLIAEAATRRGDWGLAVKRLRSVLGRRPDLVQLRVRLAELLVEHRELEDAAEQIDQIEALDPGHESVPRLRAALLAQSRDFKNALAIYEQIDLDQNPAMVRPLVQAYLGSGQRDKARQVLAERYAKNPGDLGLMQMLVALTENQEQRLAILEQARAAGIDSQLLDVFARQIRGDRLQIEELVSMMAQRSDDPLDAALREAQMLRQAGRTEAAAAALERAAAIDATNPQVIELRFEQALRDRDLDKARQLADEAARLNLDLANGAFYRGRLRAVQGEVRAAIELMRQGLEARPEYPEGHRMLGLLLRQNGQLNEAVAAFNRALDNQPDNVETLIALAATYAALDRNADALAAMRRAYQANPRNNAVFNQYARLEQNLGDPDRVIVARTERAQFSPQDLDNRRALAILLAQQERYQEGLEVINAVIEQEGRTLPNIATLASVHRAAERPELGLEVVEDYLAAQGDQITMQDHLLLARYLRSIDRLDEMVSAYHAAIALENPESRSASREFADTLFTLNRNDTALTLYQELHEQYPEDQAIRLRLAETYIRAGQPERAETLVSDLEATATTTLLQAMAARQRGNPQEAIRLIDQALTELEAGNARGRAMLLLQRGQILAGQQDFAAAISDLRQAVDLNPNMTQARMLLAAAYRSLGRLDQSARQLRELLANNPDNREARLQLVNLYLAEPNLPAARTLLDEAIARDPEDPLWPQFRARVALAEQSPDEAQRQWRRAMQLQPNPGALGSLATLLIDQDQPAEALAALDEYPEMVEASSGLTALRGRAMHLSGSTQAARQVFVASLERADNVGQLLQVTQQIGATYDDPSAAIKVIESAQNPALGSALAFSVAQLEAADDRYDKALSRIDRALAGLGEDQRLMRVSLMRLRGVVLYQLDRPEAAAEAYEQVMAIAPNDTQTLNNYAFLLLDQQRDLDRAIELAQQAANQAPASGAVLDTLGWAQFKAGQIEQARQTLQRAATLGDLAATHYHLAMVLEAQRQAASDPVIRRNLRDRAIGRLEQAIAAAEAQDDPKFLQKAQDTLDEWSATAAGAANSR